MAKNELIRAVCSAITPLLSNIGFRKRAGHWFTKDLKTSTIGLAYFDTSSIRPTNVATFVPVIGIRFQTLEQIVDDLGETDFSRGGTSLTRTVGTALGYLMPENTYLQWYISAPDEVPDAADGMATAIQYYGSPYFERYQSLKESITLMYPDNNGGDLQHGARLAVAYAMVGERDRAIQVVDHWLAKLQDPAIPGRKWLEVFARNFRDRLDSIPMTDS